MFVFLCYHVFSPFILYSYEEEKKLCIFFRPQFYKNFPCQFWYDSRLRCDMVDLYYVMYGRPINFSSFNFFFRMIMNLNRILLYIFFIVNILMNFFPFLYIFFILQFWYDSRLRCDMVDLYYVMYGRRRPFCLPIPELAALGPGFGSLRMGPSSGVPPPSAQPQPNKKVIIDYDVYKKKVEKKTC